MTTKTVRDIDLPIDDQDINIIAPRGNTLESDLFTHFGPDGVTPIDWTEATIECKATLSDGTEVDLTSYLVIDAEGGSYYLTVPPSVTNGATPWPAGLGTFAITITDTAGRVKTYYAGAIGLREVPNV